MPFADPVPLNADLLFVIGQGKTGTSTVVGILNSHPDILLFYEAYLIRHNPILPRRIELQKTYPDLSPLLDSAPTFRDTYLRAGGYFQERGHSYRYFGEKMLSKMLSEEQMRSAGQFRVIFVVRDIRTWLCKNIVVSAFIQSEDLATMAVRYVDDLLQTFAWPKCLRIRMEDLILQNDRVLADLSAFLGLELAQTASNWWDTIGHYPDGDPKRAIDWWSHHDSSRLKPTRQDTEVTLRDHPLWHALLPVFDKYYGNPATVFPPDEIVADRQRLRQVLPCSVTHEDLYESVRSVSFGSGPEGAAGHRSTNPKAKPFLIGSKETSE